MKFFGIALFALSTAVSCTLASPPEQLIADAKAIAASVTELRTVIAHHPTAVDEDAYIFKIGYAARDLYRTLYTSTVNVQDTTFISVSVATTLAGVIGPIEVETIGVLQEIVAAKDYLLRYRTSVLGLLSDLRSVTDAYAEAYVRIAPPGFAYTIDQLQTNLDKAYDATIHLYIEA